MKSFQKKLRLATVLLHELSRQSLCRINLEKKFVSKGGSHATFESTMLFLLRDSYIKKSGLEKRAPYCITEKGKRFLEVLTWS